MQPLDTEHDIFLPRRPASQTLGANGVSPVSVLVDCVRPTTSHGRQTKVALRCSDEEELLLLQAKAQSLNLCARSIQDAWVLLAVVFVHVLIFYCFRGRTQVAAGSRTVLGIGPGVCSPTLAFFSRT